MITRLHNDYSHDTVYGDPVGYHRTPEDDRIRALFWCVVFPMYLIGLGIVWGIRPDSPGWWVEVEPWSCC